MKKKIKISLFILIFIGLSAIPFCFLNHDTTKIRTAQKKVKEDTVVYTCDEAYWTTAYGFDPNGVASSIVESGDNWVVTVTGIPSTLYVMITSDDVDIQDIDEAGNQSGAITPGVINSNYLLPTIAEGQTTGTVTWTVSQSQTLDPYDLTARNLQIVIAPTAESTSGTNKCPALGAIYEIPDPPIYEADASNPYYNPDTCNAIYTEKYSGYPEMYDSIPYCQTEIVYESDDEVQATMDTLDQLYEAYLALELSKNELEEPGDEYTKAEFESHSDKLKKITLSCDAFTDNDLEVKANKDGEEYSDNYANQDKFYAQKTVYENAYCSTECQERVTVSYQAPVATQAGICFPYKVDVQSTVECTVNVKIAKPKKSDFPVCKAVSACVHSGGSTSKRGGPEEDFDACVVDCDGGEYTQSCIDTCYDEVYDEEETEEDLDDYSIDASTLSYSSNLLVQNDNIHVKLMDNPVNVNGTTVSCNASFQGPRPLYLKNDGTKYDAEEIYKYRRRNPGGYYSNTSSGWAWVPAGDCPSSVAYEYFQSKSMTKATLKRFRNVLLPSTQWKGGNRPYENREGFQVVRIRKSYTDANANVDAGARAKDNNLAAQLLSYDCHSNCSWKAGSMTYCNGENATLTKWQQTQKYKAALSTWTSQLHSCAIESRCNTQTTSYTINVTENDKVNQYKGSLGATPSPTLPSIVEHAGGKCYNIDEMNDYWEELQYHNVVSFPKRWLSVKSGLTITDMTGKNENHYLDLGNVYCPTLSSDYVNTKWYRWKVYENEPYLSEEAQENFFNDEPRKDNIKVKIGQSGASGDHLWGLLGWRFEINCFYAVGCPEGDCPPTTKTPPPDTDCPEPPCPPVPTTPTEPEDPMPTFEFRTIALNDMFPNRSAHFNWSSAATNLSNEAYPINPTQLIENIKNNATSIFTDSSELDYEIDITADQLKNIKNGIYDENETKPKNYLDFNESAIQKNSNGVSVYTSSFLNRLGSIVKKRGVVGCNNERGGTCSS